jgi:hypothetical protein
VQPDGADPIEPAEVDPIGSREVRRAAREADGAPLGVPACEPDAPGDGARRKEMQLQGIDLEAPAGELLHPAENLPSGPLHRPGRGQDDDEGRRDGEQEKKGETE